MSRGLFIAGTDTGVGKTRVTVALLQVLRAHGVRACGMKPVASGTHEIPSAGASDRLNEDVDLIAPVCAPECDIRDINPYCFDLPASPHISAEQEGIEIDIAPIAASYQRLAGQCEVVLVEGTGGWLAPINPSQTMADIVRALQLPVLLVVGVRLGCLNHALLTQQAIEACGLRLAGWVGSVLEPQMLALPANIATLDARLHAPRLGLLPHSPRRDEDPQQLRVAAQGLFALQA